MGVPKFFRWLSERYPKILQRAGCRPVLATVERHFGPRNDDDNDNNNDDDSSAVNDSNITTSIITTADFETSSPDPLSECGLPPITDRLYIDMNGIIHNCSHCNNDEWDDEDEVDDDEAGNDINTNRRSHEKRRIQTAVKASSTTMPVHDNSSNSNSNEHDEEQLQFKRMAYYLDRLVTDIVQPTQLVYLAVDGVAPRAKLNQQRSRRFRSSGGADVDGGGNNRSSSVSSSTGNYTTSTSPTNDPDTEEDGMNMNANASAIMIPGAAPSSSSLSAWDMQHDSLPQQYDELFIDHAKQSNNATTIPQSSSLSSDFVVEVSPGRFAGKFQQQTQTRTPASAVVDGDDNSDNNSQFDNMTPTSRPFHSNAITPGTAYLHRCSAFLQDFVEQQVATNPAWQHLTVIYSGPNVPGEGEHKIMQFMRQQQSEYRQQQQQRDPNNHGSPLSLSQPTAPGTYHPNLRHCWVGQDGDLILLGLVTHEPNLVLLREKVHFWTHKKFRIRRKPQRRTEHSLIRTPMDVYIHNSTFEWLHMNILRDYLALELHLGSTEHNGHQNYNGTKLDSREKDATGTELERCLDDVVFLTFLVGNDFLPHMPALDIFDEALDLLLYVYRHERSKWMMLSSDMDDDDDSKANDQKPRQQQQQLDPYLTNAGTLVCPTRLESFLQVLGSMEHAYYDFKRRSGDNNGSDAATSSSSSSPVHAKKKEYIDDSADRAGFRQMMLGTIRAQQQQQQEVAASAMESDQFPSTQSEFKPVLSNMVNDTNDDDEKILLERIGALLRYSVPPSDGTKGLDDQHPQQWPSWLNDRDLKGRYYYDKFGLTPFDAAQHTQLRKAYVEGLLWNLQYYWVGCPSWDWYYPYHYGPMLSDLVGLEEIVAKIDFGRGGENTGSTQQQPLRPFEQLLAALPPADADLLPVPYRHLMTDAKHSPISDFYPETITIDMNGKRLPWEAVVLLPFIDAKRLLQASRSVDASLLSSEEIERNSVQDAVVISRSTDEFHAGQDEGTNTSIGAVQKILFKASSWNLNSKSKHVFVPQLLFGVETPLPGLPTLRDGSVCGLWRKRLCINIHGTKSRYKTACLELHNTVPEIVPLQVIAPHTIGTIVYINYPHLIECFVTAISDRAGIIRGNEHYRAWTSSEATDRQYRLKRILNLSVHGEKLVGTGGCTVGGRDVMDDMQMLLYVRPFHSLKTLSDGTVAKSFAKFEIEVPLFVMSWAPVAPDTRLASVPMRLEADPYHACRLVLTDIQSWPSSAAGRASHHVERQTHKQALTGKTAVKSTSLSMANLFNGKIRKQSRSFYSSPAISKLPQSILHLSYTTPNLPVGFQSMKGSLSSAFLGSIDGVVIHSILAFPTRGYLFIPTLPHHTRPVLRPTIAGMNLVPTTTTTRTKWASRRSLVVSVVVAAVSFWTGAHGAHWGTEFAALGGSFVHNNPSLSLGWIRNFQQDDTYCVPQKRHTPLLEFSHGTTTVSFAFRGGIVVAVDSRASMGSFVGSKTTQKVLPINSHMLGTMAGGAADCSYWIGKLRCESSLYELTHDGRRMSVAAASRILSNTLYDNRHLQLSIGTMIMGFDDNDDSNSNSNNGRRNEFMPKIFYVDNSGMRIEGDLFAVGSGSTYALGILDQERRFDMSVEEAVSLGIKAIRHATFRDASSGGYINVYLITRHEGWRHVFREDLARSSQPNMNETTNISLN